MARITKNYDERYTEFLDVAQTLFFTEGYERTSVQRIIKHIGVAKGTFYYYFDSKEEVLGAVVQRMYEDTLVRLAPLLADATLSATQKLQRFIKDISQWKTANRALMLDTLHALYRDENLLLREKLRQETSRVTAPLLADIINQGVSEGIFDVAHAQETAELILVMFSALGEALVSLLLAGQHDDQALGKIERHLAVCNRSIERILGMQAGTFTCIDSQTLYVWLVDEPISKGD